MIAIQYDMKLECDAQAYIDSIGSSTFEHNADRTQDYANCGGSGYVGENWYSGGPGADDYFGGATFAWCDYNWTTGCSEKSNFLGINGCSSSSGETGHYTQVVWASSAYVGCGYTSVGGTVCDYSPGGNFDAENPYVLGTTCSDCPTGYTANCDNGLCSNVAATSTTTIPTAGTATITIDVVTSTSGAVTSTSGAVTSKSGAVTSTSSAVTSTSSSISGGSGVITTSSSGKNSTSFAQIVSVNMVFLICCFIFNLMV